MKKIALAFIAVAMMIWALWIAFPVGAMQSMIEDSVRHEQFGIHMNGLKKGFFYRLYADSITLERAGTEMILLSSVDLKINPLSFLALRIDLSGHGRLGKGSISGDATFSKRENALQIAYRQAHIEDMQFLTMAGIRGEGTVSGDIGMTDKRWRVVFVVENAEIEPVLHGNGMVPLNFFQTITGAFTVEGNTVDVSSVSMEGRNIFARLTGVIRGDLMDLRMELMPEKFLLENPLFLSQVERYQVSPGYFVIPVKGPMVL